MAILVNGNGNARVYAAQDADLIASITGNTTVRTSVGNKMAATAADASTISVADGVIITKEGRRIQLDAGQTDLFTIPTGSAGVTNYYIIGYKLSTDSDNVQVAETFVQLMASASDTIPEGTFRGGDSEVYVSVARVEQDGLNIGTITALLPELETISEVNNDLTLTSVSYAVADFPKLYSAASCDYCAHSGILRINGFKNLVAGSNTIGTLTNMPALKRTYSVDINEGGEQYRVEINASKVLSVYCYDTVSNQANVIGEISFMYT